MKKSIFLFFAAILCTMNANAAFYYRGNDNGWGATEMQAAANGLYYYYKDTKAGDFKITNKADSWDGATEYTKLHNTYNGANITLTGGENGSNCNNPTVNGYILLYQGNNGKEIIVCASTTLPTGLNEVWIKHPWGGGDWLYKQATDNGDGTFSLSAKYGESGCNLNAYNGENAQWWYDLAEIEVEAGLNKGDDAVFTVDAVTRKISVTKKVSKNLGDITITMNCTQQPKIFFWDVEGKTCAEWPGEDMVAAGTNTYTYTFEDVDIDLGVNYKINLKEVNENEWNTGDLHTTTDVTHDVSDLNIPKIVVLGVNGDWGSTNTLTELSNDYLTVSKTISVEEVKTHDIKMHVGDNQYQGGNVVDITRANPSSEKFDQNYSYDNGKFTADIAGDYVFTYTYKTHTLTVTYPELPTPEYKDITITVYAKEVPNIWWWNGGDQCLSTEELTNPSTGNTYKWDEAPAMEAVIIDGNTWYQKKFENVDIAKGGIKFKLKSQDQSQGSSELQTTEDKCYDARVITGVTETPCGVLPEGEIAKLTYYVEVPEGTNDCYIAGEMNGWTLTQMNKVDDRHYTITIEGATIEHTYKYASGPDSDWKYVEVKTDGGDVSNRTYNANDFVEKWKAVYDPSAPTYDYYIVGSMNEWNQSSADYGMTDDDEDGIYEKKLTLKNNDEFKVKGNEWYGFDAIKGAYVETSLSNENDRNIKITLDADKEVTVKFNSETKEITFEGLTEKDPVVEDFSNQPSILYFRPSTNWKDADARFAAYFFGTEAKWLDMTDSNSDGIYEVANDKTNANVIFCRMNPATTENNWDNKWTQTDDIVIPNEADNLNTVWVPWQNYNYNQQASGIWVAPTPLTDTNWSDFVTAYKGKTINAVVERSFVYEQLHTLCLPFNVELHWLGEEAKAYKLNSVVGNSAQELSLNASECATMTAGQPYIVKPKKGSEYEYLIVADVAVQNVSAGSYTITGGGYKVTMQGIAATPNPAQQTDGSTEYWLAMEDGCLYKTPTNKLGLRSIIKMTTTSGAPVYVRARVVTGENVETGVEDIITTDTPVKVIENGQLIIIRDGVKYNVQGQKL